MYISRRVLIIVAIVSVALVAGAGAAFAYALTQANSSSANAGVTPTVSSSDTTTTPALSVTRACVLGVIRSINMQGQSFVVQVNNGKRLVTITLDDQTSILKRGKPLTLQGLSVGDRVRVVARGTCDKQTQIVSAQNVNVLAPLTPTPAASPTV